MKETGGESGWAFRSIGFTSYGEGAIRPGATDAHRQEH